MRNEIWIIAQRENGFIQSDFKKVGKIFIVQYMRNLQTEGLSFKLFLWEQFKIRTHKLMTEHEGRKCK
jgi:hypothetical protein